MGAGGPQGEMGTRFSRGTEDADRHLAGFSKATEQYRYLNPTDFNGWEDV